jgi:hypothetical protein
MPGCGLEVQGWLATVVAFAENTAQSGQHRTATRSYFRKEAEGKTSRLQHRSHPNVVRVWDA